ncbi:GNAT family N-acetyltransferase [Streptomyces hesseae]|uniref:GNAT family N-acetyltransferase n=1 Tax=Streptomyces hesseae TaxID=3075519 RepID=A0ABU2ST17_9ACTN|nr:GNAT family N-acetyltransferase [Streptomyces sp. DSM 40473]MDT0452143.1 GNAT family N-acetyltransferase [Streptomyces sp. DSM 40473]
MAETTYQRSDGPEAAALLDGFLPAYEEVYVEAPYNEGPREVAEFIERFQRQALRPGFRLLLARDDDEVVGFAFGYRLPADTSWWNGMFTPLPEEFTRETGERTFAIIELAVRKPRRRRGIARALHARLVDGLGVERVALTMRPEPEAAPAQRAYEAWGYVKVGRTQPWDEAPVYDAMVLGLR